MYTDSLVNEELIAKAKPEAEVLKTAGMHLEEMVDVYGRPCQCRKNGRANYIQVILRCTGQLWSKLRC